MPHAAALIPIDTDAGEIGRLRAVDVPVVADCAESFEVLLREAAGVSWPDLSAWRGTWQGFCHGLAALFDNAPTETRPGLQHPYQAAKAAMDAPDPGTAIVFDGGESSAWCDAHLRAAGPGLFMTNGYLGCLGISQGFAIGSAIAHPDRRASTSWWDPLMSRRHVREKNRFTAQIHCVQRGGATWQTNSKASRIPKCR